MGGPNGAGKSTFVREYLIEQTLPYICADEIAFRLSPDNPDKAKVQAGREFFWTLDELRAAGQSAIVESTLSGLGFVEWVRSFREAGFRIEIDFIYLDSTDISVERVRTRVARGGHNVPEADLRRRFSRSLTNFWNKYRPVADKWSLIYNGGGAPERVAWGDKERSTILDSRRFSVYLNFVESTAMEPMKEMPPASKEAEERSERIIRIFQRAVAKAREENRKAGVPNVTVRDGKIYYE